MPAMVRQAQQAVVAFDEAVRDKVLPACGPRTVFAADVLAVFTSRWLLIPAAVAAWTLGRSGCRDRLADGGRAVAAALAVETVAATAVKLATRRCRPARPSGRERPYTSSMPSGHTANVAAAATALAMVTHSDAVLAAGMALAAITAVSRIIVNRHWASDGAVGLVLGYASAKLVEAAAHARP
ncbi:MAG TPA: phosphatase PAP2 family protein [Azospirillum sp.]|nr:phosphatase PAP2 family protein [Azospirillum sp.]